MLATLSRWRRGFKSHRGRFCKRHGTQTAKRRSSNLRESAGSTPACASEVTFIARTTCARGTFVIADQRASAGYWRTQVAVTHPPSGNAGSTPARRNSKIVTGPFVYRFRTSASHAGKAGSIPARVMQSRERRVERQEPENPWQRTSCLALVSSLSSLDYSTAKWCNR